MESGKKSESEKKIGKERERERGRGKCYFALIPQIFFTGEK